MVYKIIYKSFVINNKYNEVLVLIIIIILILNIIKKKKRGKINLNFLPSFFIFISIKK
jgi:hypothetical protein